MSSPSNTPPPDDEKTTPSALWQQLIRENFGAWMEHYGRIRLNGKTVAPKLNVLQNRFTEAFQWCLDHQQPVRFLLLKPRQRGCSTISVAAMYWWLRVFTATACIISTKYKQVKSLWKMAQRYNSKDGFGWGFSGKINQNSGAWENESRLLQETARDEDAGRSETIEFLICTEAARWQINGVANAGDVLAGILKCVHDFPSTAVIIESTGKGPVGPFYRMWQDAVSFEDFRAGRRGAGGYVRIFAGFHEFPECCIEHVPGLGPLTPAQEEEIFRTQDREERECLDLHGLTPGQVAWRRYKLLNDCGGSSRQFDMDYPITPEHAFRASHNGRFSRVHLGWQTARPPVKGALDESRDGAVTFRPCDHDAEVTTWVWELPKDGESYLLSSDPAEGAVQAGGKDTDANSVNVLKKGRYGPHGWQPPEQVARLRHGNKWDTGILNQLIWKLATLYGQCTVVEEINKDRGLIEYLKAKGDIPIYQREVWNAPEERFLPAYGFSTSKTTRKPVIDHLANALRLLREEGSGIIINDACSLRELSTFITRPDGRDEAAPGEHDDDVFSLGIGLIVLEHATLYRKISRRDLARMYAEGLDRPRSKFA